MEDAANMAQPRDGAAKRECGSGAQEVGQTMWHAISSLVARSNHHIPPPEYFHLYLPACGYRYRPINAATF